MPEMQRVGDLEVEQDLDFARRDWLFQRIGMAAMACGLILVTLGLTGSGPLSRGEATRDGVRIRYNRFPRRDTETELFLSVSRRKGDAVEVEIATDAPEEVQVVKITPEPEAMTAGPGRLLLRFHPPDAAPLSISMTLLRHGWGWRETRFRAPSAPEVAISQFVWF